MYMLALMPACAMASITVTIKQTTTYWTVLECLSHIYSSSSYYVENPDIPFLLHRISSDGSTVFLERNVIHKYVGPAE